MTAEDKKKVLAVLDGLMEGTSGVVRATIMACKCAIDEMEVEEKWIPVADRLPEDGEAVLTCKNGIVEVQVYEKKRNGWIKGNWFWSMATVSHWIPMPEPPKEDA